MTTETVTIRGKVLGITEEYITIELSDSEGAWVEYMLYRSDVSYEGDLQPGDEATFTIPITVALDEDIVEAPEAPAADAQDNAADSECIHYLGGVQPYCDAPEDHV